MRAACRDDTRRGCEFGALVPLSVSTGAVEAMTDLLPVTRVNGLSAPAGKRPWPIRDTGWPIWVRLLQKQHELLL
jgi:hypothetical protein